MGGGAIMSSASVWVSSVVSCIASSGGDASASSWNTIPSSVFSLIAVDEFQFLIAVVWLFGFSLAIFDEDATPGSKRWWWIAMELLPMAANMSGTSTTTSAAKKPPNPPVTGRTLAHASSPARSGPAAKGGNASAAFTPCTGGSGARRVYAKKSALRWLQESEATEGSTLSTTPSLLQSQETTSVSDVLSESPVCCQSSSISLESLSLKTSAPDSPKSTKAGQQQEQQEQEQTSSSSSLEHGDGRVSSREVIAPLIVVDNPHHPTSTVDATSPNVSERATDAVQPPVNYLAKEQVAILGASGSGNGCLGSTSRSSTDSSSLCCWPECCSAHGCRSHHHQLSYYRTDWSVLSRLRQWGQDLTAAAKQCDSYGDMVVSIFSSVFAVVADFYQRIRFYVIVMAFQRFGCSTRRHFFYAMQLAALRLPLNWKQTELECYLTLKRTLQARQRWPFMWPVKDLHFDDGSLTCDGHRAYPMSSYSYLDFIRNNDVQEYAIETARKWAAGSHGPRMLGGNCTLIRELERSVAKFFGRDDSMVFSAGFLACMSAVSAVCKQGDLILGDSRIHASLRAGTRLSGAKVLYFKHNDYQHLSKLLKKHRRKYHSCWLIVESVYSMDGDTVDLISCADLAKKHDCKIILDEAHGLGVIGETGRGVEELYNMQGVCTLIVGTFSKSISCVGGYIAGSQEYIDFLDFHAPGNVFSAPIAAYCAGAAIRAFQLIDEEPWRIKKAQANARFLREALRSGLNKWPKDFPHEHKYVVEGDLHTTVIPIVFKDDMDRMLRIATELLRRHWIVAAVAFPACPFRGPRFRITATAAYTETIMTDFVTTLVEVTVAEAPTAIKEAFRL